MDTQKTKVIFSGEMEEEIFSEMRKDLLTMFMVYVPLTSNEIGGQAHDGKDAYGQGRTFKFYLGGCQHALDRLNFFWTD